jgi:hypothetical protein
MSEFRTLQLCISLFAAQLLGGAGGCSRPIRRHQAIGMSAFGQKETLDSYEMPFQPNPAHPFVGPSRSTATLPESANSARDGNGINAAAHRILA